MAILGTDPLLRSGSPVPASQSSGRQRVADALMQMGAQFAPVQSWTQGLAKIAQGGIGGYLAGQERRGTFNNDQANIAAFGSAAGQGVQQPPKPFSIGAPSHDDFGSAQPGLRSMLASRPGMFGRIGSPNPTGATSWPSS